MQQKLDQLNKYCFSAETLVWTKEGLEEIRFVSKGAEVLSRCEKTGEMAYKKVTRCYYKDTATTFELCYGPDGDGIVEVRSIDTTKDHPFWVEGRGWVNAGALEAGDQLYLQSGELIRFFGLRNSYEWGVYNLEVEDFHTYFVGIEGVWVHDHNHPGM